MRTARFIDRQKYIFNINNGKVKNQEIKELGFDFFLVLLLSLHREHKQCSQVPEEKYRCIYPRQRSDTVKVTNINVNI